MVYKTEVKTNYVAGLFKNAIALIMGPTRPLFIMTNNIDMLKLFVIIINKFIVMTRNCNVAEIFVVIIDWIIIVANIFKHAYYYS